jgi:hypothetical protein
MRKILLWCLCLLLLGSCEKDNSKCYECEITGSIIGSQYDRTETVCVASEEELLAKTFLDPQGNEMAFTCKEK